MGGLPIWIQGDDGGAAGWVMQVNEALADINLGDSGSLYLFERWAVTQYY